MKKHRARTDEVVPHSFRVDRIRLGPDRLPVLTLDDTKRPITPPIVEGVTVASADWNGFAAALELSRLQRVIFLAIWRDSVPKYKLHRMIGTTAHQVSIAHAAINKKIAHLGGSHHVSFELRDSLRPFHEERLPSGHRTWSLARLGPEFRAIMAAEQNYLHRFFNQIPEAGTQRHIFCPRRVSPGGPSMKTIGQLKTELGKQRGLLGRIDERVHRCRVAANSAEEALDQAQTALKGDQIAAVLEERESPSPALRKKLTELQNGLRHAEAELEGSLEAQRIQRATVEALEAETQARQLDEDREIFAPAMKDLYAAFEVMQAAAAGVSKILAESGRSVTLADVLFPLKPGADGWPDYQKIAKIQALQAMYNGGIAATKLDVAYDPKQEITAA